MAAKRLLLTLTVIVLALIEQSSAVRIEILEHDHDVGEVLYDSLVDQNHFVFVVIDGSMQSAFDQFFNYTGGVLAVRQVIDREEIVNAITGQRSFDPLELRIIYVLSDGTQLGVDIHIIDRNDNVPVFPTESLTVSIIEEDLDDEPLDLAIDKDEGINSVRNYSLVNDEDGLFSLSISYREGNNEIIRLVLRNTRTIDREMVESFELELRAIEGVAENPREAIQTITVIIGDKCDHPPMFSMSRFHPPPVPENSPSGFVIFRNVTAYDPDSIDRNALRYNIDEVCRRQNEGAPCSSVTDDQHPFMLDTDAGLLVLEGQLDREQYALYEVSIHATDSCGRPDSAAVVVTVADVNDNCPSIIFQPRATTNTIRETSGPMSIAGFVTIMDDDSGENGEFTNDLYEWENGVMVPSATFDLEQRQVLELRLNQTIDRENKSEYSLVLVARDGGDPSCETTLNFTLFVEDANDNPPVIQREDILSVYEINEVGQNFLITTLQATDADDPATGNGEVRYELPPTSTDYPFQDLFSIEEETGCLKSAAALDRELYEHLFVLVVAYDNPRFDSILNSRDPVLNDSIVINVTLTDINDNDPVIHDPLPVFTVLEDFPTGQRLFTINATDRDTPIHATLTYSLSPSGLFTVSPSTGEVFLGSAGLDYETATEHTVTMTVSDGERADVEILIIQVSNLNDEPPVMERTMFFAHIREEIQRDGDLVVNVNASDPDVGDVLTYHILSGNDLGHFEIDASSGRITTDSSLDKEEVANYTLIVRANDGLRFSEDATEVLVDVLDVNDNPPMFINAPYEFSISEGLQASTTVEGTTPVQVSDSDSGENMRTHYRILGANPEGAIDWFIIDDVSGVIRTSRELDREDSVLGASSVVRLSVAAVNHQLSDSGSELSDIAEASITILDLNDESPTFATDSVTFNVPENHPRGQPFGSVQAVDLDQEPNNIIVYEIRNIPPGILDHFRIIEHTGELVLKIALDYESSTSADFIVRAKDSLRPNKFDDINVHINVTNTADSCLKIDNFVSDKSIPENSGVGTEVLVFEATNLEGESVSTVEYTLTNYDGTPSAQFAIEEQRDLLARVHTTSSMIDREMLVANGGLAQYVLNITAHDTGSSAECVLIWNVLTVTITDVNDNPPAFESSSFEFQIPENSVPAILGPMVANDFDEGLNGVVVYSIESGVPFTITTIGDLRSTEILDRDPPDGIATYSFTVTATDSGDPAQSTSVDVTVNVQDLNDNDPEFDPSQNTTICVRENTRVGEVLKRISVTDIDEGENAEFTVTISDRADPHFELLPNGTLILRMPLDRETTPDYHFEVKAEDNGGRSNTVRIDIVVDDVNDNAPVFGAEPSEPIIIREDHNTSIMLSQLTITDEDIGVNERAIFVLEDRSLQTIFNINERTGEFFIRAPDLTCERPPVGTGTLLKPLDYERQSSYRFNVLAVSDALPTLIDSKELEVIVQNVNEHEPVFDSSLFTVVVDEGSDDVGIRVRAYDRDGDSLTYTVLENGEPTLNFHYQNGALLATTRLNYKDQQVYEVTLRAQELSTEERHYVTTHITVYVRNINDHQPVFDSQNYRTSATIPESTPTESVVLTVHADDGDNNTHDAVSYEIDSGNEDNAFRIDSRTGDIIVQSALDYDSIQTYTLSIVAKDTGINPLSSTALEIRIMLQNLNDEYPVYSEDVYEFSYTENSAPGTIVGSVEATDRDEYPYGTVRYSLLDGPNDYFELDTSNGEVRSLVVIDRESVEFETQVFTVLASDSGQPSKTATAQVIVRIADANDHPPKFTDHQYYSYGTPSSLTVGGTVLSLADYVTDEDQGSNAASEFEILSESSSELLSVSLSGEVSLREALPTNPAKIYKAVVRVYNTEDPSLSSTAIVWLAVEGENDRHPRFEPAEGFSESIKEGMTTNNLYDLSEHAEDPDDGANGELTYHFLEDYPDFSIHPALGVISVSSPLDYEQYQTIVLRVAATDGSQPPRTVESTLTVTVLSANDNSPQFDDLPASITLSPIPAASIELFTVTAFDDDLGSDGILTFSLMENDQNSANFAIDEDSGVVRSSRPLTTGTFNIAVTANDSELTVSAGITIVIREPENPPVFVGVSNPHIIPSVREDSSSGTLHPYDTQQPALFRLVYSDGPPELFSISRTQGTLLLHGTLDFLAQSEYNLYIEAYEEDTADPDNIIRSSTYLAVLVQVDDVNDHFPRLTEPTRVTVLNEDDPIGTYVFTAQAFDEDTGDFGTLYYRIVSGDDLNTFTINETSGVITTSALLDREAFNFYELDIRASDVSSQPKQDDITLRVEIEDRNDFVPRFEPQGNVSIEVFEYPHTRSGDGIIKVAAIDEDVGPPLTYSLSLLEARFKGQIVPNPPQDSFRIERENSGLVSVGTSTQLDYESIDYYLLRVDVTDSVHDIATHLEVHILDANDHSPQIHPVGQVVVWEEQPVDTLVAEISSSDEDEGLNGVVTYSLGEEWAKHNGAFAIDPHSGTIRMNRTFSGSVWETVSVIATDQGSPPRNVSATFILNVFDVNNHKPVFSNQSYVFSISKASEDRDVVGRFGVADNLDKVSNSGIFVSIPLYYREAGMYFTVSPTSFPEAGNGVLTLQSARKLEAKNYTFRLEAENLSHFPRCPHYNQIGYADVTVVVYPECPVLPNASYSFDITEGTSPHLLETFTAIPSSTSGRVVEYFFSDDSELPFQLNRETGDLTLEQELDREVLPEYFFQVVASNDPFQPPCTTNITVTVLDVNDNPPTFPSSVYTTSVPENMDPVMIGNVNATDSDAGDNSRLRYALSGPTTVPFRVDEDDGTLYNTVVFDAERDEREYSFEVMAYDHGVPSLAGSISVTVTITDLNEFDPVFVRNLIPPVGTNAMIGDIVGRIEVQDNDTTSDLTFEFVNDAPKKYFELDRETGDVYLVVSQQSSTIVKRSLRKRQTDTSSDYFDVEAQVLVTDGPEKNITETVTFHLHNSFSQEPANNLMLIIIIMVASSVVAVIVIFLCVIIIACACRRKRISKKAQIKVSATPRNMELEHFHRRGTGSRSSTPGQHRQTGNTYLSGHNTLHHSSGSGSDSSRQSYCNYADDEFDSPNEGMGRSAYHSPGLSKKPQTNSSHARSTSDLASSVGTDMLGSQQLPHPKHKIAAIYAAHHGLLNNHGSQESIHSNHTFASEGGGEADAEADINNMLYTKYEFDDDEDEDDVTTLPDDSSYIGKDSDSTGNLNIPPVEEEMRHYPYSQPMNEWVPRAMPMEHAITELSELASFSSSQEQHVQMPRYDPQPMYGGGASSQGSRISLLRHNGQVPSLRQPPPHYTHDMPPRHMTHEYESYYGTPPQEHRQTRGGLRYGSATGLSMSQEYSHHPRDIMQHNRREPVERIPPSRGQQPRYTHFSQDVPPTYHSHSQGHHYIHRGGNIQTPSTDTPTDGTVTPHRAMGQDYDHTGYMSSSSTSLGSTNLSGTTSSIGAGRNIYRQ